MNWGKRTAGKRTVDTAAAVVAVAAADTPAAGTSVRRSAADQLWQWSVP